MVNVTDFLEFNEFIQLFQVDEFAACMSALVQERELNYKFEERQLLGHDLGHSFNAEHLEEMTWK